MSEPIKPGDMVMLVWACCAKGRRHLGGALLRRGLIEDKGGYQPTDAGRAVLSEIGELE